MGYHGGLNGIKIQDPFCGWWFQIYIYIVVLYIYDLSLFCSNIVHD